MALRSTGSGCPAGCGSSSRAGLGWTGGDRVRAAGVRARRLTVSDASVLERDALPGFTTHAVVTRNPDRVGENQHASVLVTISIGWRRRYRHGGRRSFLNDAGRDSHPWSSTPKRSSAARPTRACLPNFVGTGMDFRRWRNTGVHQPARGMRAPGRSSREPIAPGSRDDRRAQRDDRGRP
jgi:hypothetical protein